MALGFFRRHRQWLYAFLWIVILAFVVLYVPAFQGDQEGSPGETLGRVGTLTITVNEYQKLYAERRQMYERIYQGRGIDSNMLREMGLPDQVFQELVQSRLLDLEAHRLGLAVDDAALAAAIARMPQFQREGQFVGGEEVRRRLALQGLSIEDFEASVRRNLLHEKLQGVVTDGISVADDEAERTYRERNEQAKIEYVLVDAARFRAQASASDDEVKTWFAAHPESYRIPEKRVLAYVAIDREALKSQVAVTDYDIKTYYKENEERFREEEQVCASHILIKTQSDPKAAVGHPEAEAKKLAEALLAKVKGGADFAALAKQSSEDEGSKVKGGSLDCFTRERMVPEFSEVAFNLKAGETSELVKSPYGYHIIRVTEHRDEVVQPLPQVRERIQDTLLATKANERAEEKAEAIAR
ncbi:MAG: peptidylprolyl isomerase, partial [Vicinamibacteria bacterium]|nr:peptidylprolyl isomerase [Vicinamibacteria bacterium]